MTDAAPLAARVAARLVDGALEATVAPSFSRVGHALRARLHRWGPPAAPGALAGRTVLVTGATSGIGLAACCALARAGASVRITARDPVRAEAARDQILEAAAAGGAGADPESRVGIELVDLADLEAVRSVAARVAASVPRLHALVHNAGALHRRWQVAPGGTEATAAAGLLGPHLLTGLLLPVLAAAAPGRVLWVTSGGMYTQRLRVDRLDARASGFDGVRTYARVKRAQVALCGEWARRVDEEGVVFHSLHPGWVDTPGLRRSLPGFARMAGPLLRRPAEGADTLVWLVADPEGARGGGALWHDRRRRPTHRLPWTTRGDDPAALWAWCAARTGWPPPEPGGQPEAIGQDPPR